MGYYEYKPESAFPTIEAAEANGWKPWSRDATGELFYRRPERVIQGLPRTTARGAVVPWADLRSTITDNLLTDEQLAELDTEGVVVRFGKKYERLRTDDEGRNWLQEIQAGAGSVDDAIEGVTDIAAEAAERRLQLYYGIVERRAAGENIDAELGDDILELAGKSMDDFNRDVYELQLLNLGLDTDEEGEL